MDIEERAKSFNVAMKGSGTDENRIIKELLLHNKAERQLIKDKYFTMFGHTLEEDFKSETSGHFQKGICALILPTIEYEAQCLNGAMKGAGTDAKTLIDILCVKESSQILALKAVYNKMYGRDLDKDIEKDTSGNFGRIMRSVVQAERPGADAFDIDLAKKEAQELYDAGEGKMGTDEITFVRILCSRSFAQLNETSSHYLKICGKDIEKAIKKEMSGDLERACLAIIKTTRSVPAFFADRLHESMKGIGTKDDDLVRILVSRCEIDLPEIKYEYKNAYGKNLYDRVKSETSGDYQKLFLGIIGKDQ